jgi:hypothetical protein
MKTVLVMISVLWAVSAAAQAGSVNYAAPSMLQMPDHPQHASVHAMGTEQPVVGGETYTVLHGERPLWEFGSVKEEPSLGDVARAYRKEKLSAKKAEIIFEKQGS